MRIENVKEKTDAVPESIEPRRALSASSLSGASKKELLELLDGLLDSDFWLRRNGYIELLENRLRFGREKALCDEMEKLCERMPGTSGAEWLRLQALWNVINKKLEKIQGV